uniref:Uncharacterized protein n=1 Tax=Chromera velia CCMP2878 TaxID=1169474 RepID=A0A0G4FJG4_9ALVE|eukprot:Cvel_3421.t1-p1 / transcript=Cvel_3421.t1 / gene=Cvel_3421 / organism=Chromera_velia_CCMP2878 / gene_product=hypothetical protein / transcript_product=hypothetical protein / location=Cvel_scaffold137:91269-92124(-) / protein_length=119 / sequence_SO=supercontig / SO=protein_coding / is_pseudo=false
MTFDPVPDGAPIPSEAEAETALRSLIAAQKIPQAEVEFGIRLAFAFADFVTKNWSESSSFTTDHILSEALAKTRQDSEGASGGRQRETDARRKQPLFPFQAPLFLMKIPLLSCLGKSRI